MTKPRNRGPQFASRPAPAAAVVADRATVARIDPRANEARNDLAPGARVAVVAGRFAGEIVEIVSVRRTPVGMVIANVRDGSGTVRVARAGDLARSS